MLARRAALSRAEVEAASRAVCERAQSTLEKYSHFFLYRAFGNEIDPALLVKSLVRRGAEVYIIERDHDLAQAVAFIPEVIVCPAVAVSEFGDRLGRGGGFYDRLFAIYPEAFRVALIYDWQHISDVSCEDHDVPIQDVFSDKRRLTFSQK